MVQGQGQSAIDLEDIAASAEFCPDYLLAFRRWDQLLLGEMLPTSAHPIMSGM